MASTKLAPSLGASSTSEDVLAVFGKHMAGRVVLVTGASSGIGLVVAKTLAQAGATVVAAVLPGEAAATLAALRATAPHPEKVEVLSVDLGDLLSVRGAAAAFIESGRPLHLLVNNAGIMGTPLRPSAQGFESQVAINYLGHWELTRALLPPLRAGAPSRVVAVSSAGHILHSPQIAAMDWESLGAPASSLGAAYNPMHSYGGSKLAIALHMAELQRRSVAEGWGVTTASVHPGAVKGTHIANDTSTMTLLKINMNPKMWPVVFGGIKSPEQGAATVLAAAMVPELPAPGAYYSDCAAVPAGHRQLSPIVYNADAATRLWETTATIIVGAVGSDAPQI